MAMTSKSSTTKRAAPAKLAEKAKPAAKASAKPALEALMRKFSGDNTTKVAGEIAKLVKQTGPAIAPVAQELFTLHAAVEHGEHALIAALIEAGIDREAPPVDSEDSCARALETRAVGRRTCPPIPQALMLEPSRLTKV